jgi:hypothetical protein
MIVRGAHSVFRDMGQLNLNVVKSRRGSVAASTGKEDDSQEWPLTIRRPGRAEIRPSAVSILLWSQPQIAAPAQSLSRAPTSAGSPTHPTLLRGVPIWRACFL